MSSFPPFAHGAPVQVVAHRGASRAARENTVEAFTKARALRADGVELDVRRTADAALVVHHDAELAGVGVLVARTLAELREAAPWMPTLEEALSACDGLWVNVEIKNLPIDPDWDPDERLAGAVAALLEGAGSLAGRVIVSAFNPTTLLRVRERASELPTALLTVGGFDPLAAVETAALAGHVALHPSAASVLERLDDVVAAARDAGLSVVPWTVDEPEEIRLLAEAGVAGVITNVPDVARRALTGSPA